MASERSTLKGKRGSLPRRCKEIRDTQPTEAGIQALTDVDFLLDVAERDTGESGHVRFSPGLVERGRVRRF
jgi:hypothetical protein